MKATIFFSWQSDLPPALGRVPIQDALTAAIRLLAEDASLVVRPELDHDTHGIPGSPSVIAAILRKIDECSVFVGDVTLTFERAVQGQPRHAPNPNVLVELGYALKRLGRERILLLLNPKYGAPEQLPFDLRGDRVITVDPNEGEQLVEKLREQLHLIISKSGPPPDVLPPVEIQFKRVNQQIDQKRHEYRLSAVVRNSSDEILTDWSVEMSFPKRVILARSFGSLPRQDRDGYTILRQVQADHSGPLYPGESRELIGIDYYMDDQTYDNADDLFKRDVTVSVYSGSRRIARKTVPFRDLQEF